LEVFYYALNVNFESIYGYRFFRNIMKGLESADLRSWPYALRTASLNNLLEKMMLLMNVEASIISIGLLAL
jgi:hypothetical protein